MESYCKELTAAGASCSEHSTGPCACFANERPIERPNEKLEEEKKKGHLGLSAWTTHILLVRPDNVCSSAACPRRPLPLHTLPFPPISRLPRVLLCALIHKLSRSRLETLPFIIVMSVNNNEVSSSYAIGRIKPAELNPQVF